MKKIPCQSLPPGYGVLMFNTTPRHNNTRLPLWAVHCLMLMAATIVSGSFTVGKAITHGLDPAVLLLIRYIIASSCLGALLLATNSLTVPPLRKLGGYSMVSACTAGFFWCMFESLRYTDAINTSVIFTLVPGISGIYSAIFLKERLGRYRITALFFGMIGAIWVIFRGDIHRLLALDVNEGDLLFLGGCFLMAAYTPLVKKVHTDEPMTLMTFWVLATGVCWLFIPAAARLPTITWHEVEPMVWAGILYLAILSTIVTFYLTHTATLYIGPTRVMAYSYFYPSFVLLINWVLGKGLPPAIVMPGIAVVTMATIILQRGASTEPLKTG